MENNCLSIVCPRFDNSIYHYERMTDNCPDDKYRKQWLSSLSAPSSSNRFRIYMKKQRDNKGRFLPGNSLGNRFTHGNKPNNTPPQYRYVCTNCGYCGQYIIGIGVMQNHFSNCSSPSLPDNNIKSIIESVSKQYPNYVLNVIAQDYDLSDEMQMASFFSDKIRERDKSNIPLLKASLLYMADFHGLGK